MPRSLLAVLPLLSLAATPLPADRCAVARQATGFACRETPRGVVLAADAGEAARLATYAAAGELRWHRHFGGAAIPYAVLQTGTPEMTRALHAAGFPIVLPWLSPAQYAASSAESVRRATEARAKAQGLSDPAQLKSAGDQAIAAWQAKHPPSEWTEKEAGAVPHEVGHMWYIARYWPHAQVDGAGHYGGPGPDWMDETAAVLMEDDRLAGERRTQFAKYFADRSPEGATARTTITDLATFLHREHPAKGLQDMIAARAAGSPGSPDAPGPRILVISAEEAKGRSQIAALFYLQARLFADFLIARAGDPAVFADIGAAFGRGETIEQWLAARGPTYHLGRTVAEVRVDWIIWLEMRAT